MITQLSGTVAIVTGASSGIGAATARTLARAGASVVLGARRVDRLGEIERQIVADGGRAIVVPCDVRDEGQVQALTRQSVEYFGRLDILVNNAGVMLQSRIEHDLSDEWRQMLETNVLGLLYSTSAAIPHLRASKGHIINISSVAGHKARERGGVYSATKWGVNAISESLRLELLQDQIRVTVIAPGTTETELANHITDPESLAIQQENLKQMRPLQDEDVAQAILWALTQPRHVSVSEVLMRPVGQVF